MLEAPDMRCHTVSFSSIENWTWIGCPLSMDPAQWDSLRDQVLFKEIDWLIQQAPTVEALTSSSVYIRECKRWFNAQRS